MLGRLGYFFLTALHNIKKNLMIHAMATGTIALSLLILGTVSCIFLNLNDFMKRVREEIGIILFLQDGLSQVQVQNLKEDISRIHEVDRIFYVSKEEALQRLKTQLKDQDDILEGLENNPLPASFEIKLRPKFQNLESAKILAQRLENIEGIDEVQYGEAWTEWLMNTIKLVQLVASVIFVLLFVLTTLIIFSTIRLTIYARRDELEIMKLIGATNLFIKMPFYIEGLLQGFIGGVISVSVLYAIYYLFTLKIESHPLSICFLPAPGVLGIVGAGVALGFFGSLTSFRGLIKT